MFYNNRNRNKNRGDPNSYDSDDSDIPKKWWLGNGLLSSIISTVSSALIIAILTSATTFLYRIAEQGSILNDSLQKLTIQVDKLDRSLTSMDARIKQLELERCRNANPNDPYAQRNC